MIGQKESMGFEGDDAKDAANRRKHGIGFDSVDAFDWEGAVLAPDTRRDYGEERIVAFGFLEDRLHVCAFTLRGEARRIISLRKANAREERIHEQITQALDE